MTQHSKATISFVLLLLLIAVGSLTAQESRVAQPQWWFGGALGINFNYYGGDTRTLNSTLSPSNTLTKGSGTGLFLSPMLEYRPDPVWGGILYLGYDNRSGSFDEVTGGGVISKVKTSMNYISIEPSLKVTPFSSGVYFFAGPRLGFNVSKSYEYSEPGSGNPVVSGEWSGIRGAVVTFNVGAGYDISLTSSGNTSQINLSPFVGIHFGQGPRSQENWTLSSVRLGAALKFGSTTMAQEAISRETQFSVRAPRIIPTERRVKETFPMRNNVFFDEGSTGIPNRYVLLTSGAAASFREDHLVEPQPKDLTGRSRRQLTVYHNILNILGDRMRNNSQATVTLTGSSSNGSTEGRQFAEAVKSYLVDVFGISASRITTAGREKPEVPSVQPGASRELDLVRPEDRRVDISSSSPDLLEPVQIVSLQDDPLDSDVILTVPNAQENLASWSVEITDEKGSMKRFGPFTRDQERIAGREIIGSNIQGRYTVVLLGQTKGGQTVRKEESVKLVRSDEPQDDLGLRFSILFEFDQSKTVATYERFLSNVVAPLIPDGGSVTIHGHTDIIGEESHNLKLSRDRAEETRAIIERALSKAGKRRVKFDAYGFGEDARRAPFENTLPEERFYNRTVIIDIIPE